MQKLKKDDEWPMVYKGYKLYPEFKTTKYRHNPLSGHSWSEQRETGKIRVVGNADLPIMITNVFSNIEKAKDYIDFTLKWIPPLR
jgi:hypothetical protein